MGIKGLLPLLKPVQRKLHIKEYAGEKVAVDGHCWLHRGSFGCASELARGVPSESYVSYFIHMVKLLLHNNVIPVIVFDGQRLPIKNVTNEARSKVRKEKLEQGLLFQKEGRYSDAMKCFQQAIHITPAMVAKVIKELDKMNVQHIVSPYEADPQLTFLIRSGQVKAVITEDSDLLAYGASRVIIKMDRFGEGQQVIYADMFTNPLCMRPFNPETFRHVCILSGCDYLPSLPGVGLMKAQEMVRKNRITSNIFLGLSRTYSSKVVEEYKEGFYKANAAFLYQFVFDPSSRTYKRLNPLPKDITVGLLVGLGESPQNRSVPILESNKAIHLDKKVIDNEGNKENIDPFANLDDSEFGELEFDESILKDVESILDKVDPIVKKEVKPRSNRPTKEQITELILGSCNLVPPTTKKTAKVSSPTEEKKFMILRDPPAPSATKKDESSSSTSSASTASSSTPVEKDMSRASPFPPLQFTTPTKPAAERFKSPFPPLQFATPTPKKSVAERFKSPFPPLQFTTPTPKKPAAERFKSPFPPLQFATPTPKKSVAERFKSPFTSPSPATSSSSSVNEKWPNPFDRFRQPVKQEPHPMERDPFAKNRVDPFKGIKPFVLVYKYPDPFANIPLPFSREGKRKHDDNDEEKKRDSKSQRL